MAVGLSAPLMPWFVLPVFVCVVVVFVCNRGLWGLGGVVGFSLDGCVFAIFGDVGLVCAVF